MSPRPVERSLASFHILFLSSSAGSLTSTIFFCTDTSLFTMLVLIFFVYIFLTCSAFENNNKYVLGYNGIINTYYKTKYLLLATSVCLNAINSKTTTEQIVIHFVLVLIHNISFHRVNSS